MRHDNSYPKMGATKPQSSSATRKDRKGHANRPAVHPNAGQRDAVSSAVRL